MQNFFLRIMTVPAVMMLLAVSSSCVPHKNAGMDNRTLVNSNRTEEDRGARLSQQALDEYRKGNLASAISIWKSILAFDPDNPAVVKAINTATIQLKNLEQIKE
jgi:outer membrane protein assembly factor BamD (BamD/ComL family)